MAEKILITGGAGYIGSHFLRLLKEQGVPFEVLDDLRRGNLQSVPQNTVLHRIDLCNRTDVFQLFEKGNFTAVVHFASYAYVGESVNDPMMYFWNNVTGGINLIDAVVKFGTGKFILSSTCSIYGNRAKIPIDEKNPPDPINPYASTKLMLETILQDASRSGAMKFLALRYFNAAGAHHSGEIGESHEPEPHLIPLVIGAAFGDRPRLRVFGSDYPTPDGTCIRDYIHVEDLADAHLLAIRKLDMSPGNMVVNLGTGSGTSVLEIINKVQSLSGKTVPYDIAPRREGDPAELVADNKLARSYLGWTPKHDIDSILKSAIKWQMNKRF